jgi:hypothetical protein
MRILEAVLMVAAVTAVLVGLFLGTALVVGGWVGIVLDIALRIAGVM